MERSLLTSLLILSCLSTVQCQIQCYICSSTTDSRCGDRFQPLVPSYSCPGTCLKYRGERWSRGVRTVEVNRVCGQTTTEGCSDGVEHNGISTRRCGCNTNLCNQGNQVSSSWIAGVLATCFVSYTLF